MASLKRNITATTNLDKCLKIACEHNRRDIADYLIARGASHSSGFIGACRGGHRELAEFMFSKTDEFDLDAGYMAACRGGHSKLAKHLLDTGVDEIEGGIFHACRNGHLQLANYLIEKIGDDGGIDEALCGACYGGQQLIAEKMIERGATDLNSALHNAINNAHWVLAKRLIELGATDLDGALFETNICDFGRSDEFAEYLIARGAKAAQ